MRGKGFTLVELLVVTATTALLMVILIPSLQSARQQASAVLCGSNIKQLVFGLAMYETENETLPHGFDNTPMNPPPGGYPGEHAYDRMGWWWFNHITDYSRKDSRTDSIIWCPSRQVKNHKLKGDVLCANYGVNQSICKSSRGRMSHTVFIGRPLCSTNIPHPSQALLIVDSGYSLISWWHAADKPPVVLGNTIIEDTAYIPGLEINKDKNLWVGQHQDAIEGRHPNKTVNVGFADGHVERVKAIDLFVEKTIGDYKNKSPLWVPQ
jgi:prepilin-type processing-associated H-X9-DG protein